MGRDLSYPVTDRMDLQGRPVGRCWRYLETKRNAAQQERLASASHAHNPAVPAWVAPPVRIGLVHQTHDPGENSPRRSATKQLLAACRAKRRIVHTTGQLPLHLGRGFTQLRKFVSAGTGNFFTDSRRIVQLATPE